MIKKPNLGYCDKCNKKVLVPCWKLCADCDYFSYRKKYFRRQLRMYQARLRAERVAYKNEKYKNATTILFDDVTGKIIGYRLTK
jgi:hypothetical protein